MRILAIRGQNLASLARSFELCLAHGALAGVGLFAITGPVGAGKSTLLDALCLALFDRTPRLSGRGGVLVGDDAAPDEECLRSNDPRTLLRRDAAEGHAEVDFSGRDGVRYRARWTVRRARRRIDGRVQDQELSLRDLDRDVVVAAGRKSDVLAAIERRLGLDFQQFCRSVLLAQGEFAAFLRASPDERARLLENLTGADLYRRLSRAAHERRKVMQADVDRLAAQTQLHVLLDPTQRAAVEAQVRQRSDELAVSQLGIDLAQAYVTWHAAAAQLRQQEGLAVVALENAKAAHEQAAPRRARCARLQQALTLLPRAEQVMEWQRRLTRATATVEDARRQQAAAVDELARRQAGLAGELEAVFGTRDVPPLVAERGRWQGVLERWLRAGSELASAAAQLPVLTGLATAAAAALAPLQARVAAAEGAQRAAETALATAQQAVAEPVFGGLPAARRAAQQARDVWRGLRERHGEWQRVATDLLRSEQQLAARTAARERLLAAFPVVHAEREGAERALQGCQQQLEHWRARHAASALRAHLIDGEPCPLCGAEEHPAPVQAAEAEWTAAVAAEAGARRRFDAAHDAQRTLELQRREAERLLADAQEAVRRAVDGVALARSAWQAAAGPGAPSSLAEVERHLADQERQLAAQERALEAQAASFEALQHAYETARAAERRAVDACRGLQLELQRATEAAATTQRAQAAAQDEVQRRQAEVDERTQELAPACDGIVDWEARLRGLGARALTRLRELAEAEQRARAAAQAVREREATFAAAMGQLEAVREDLRLANLAYEAALGEAGVRPVEVREAGELGAAAVAAEAAALQELDLAVARERGAVQARTAARREHEAGNRPELDAADAAAALEDARRARQRIDAELQRCRQELHFDDTMRRSRDELAPQLLAAEQALAVWTSLDELIGSSHGDAFAVFAQGLTLDLLLAEANRRLHELARRYQLQKNHGGELDFVVVDLDLGATRRSLQTLSGGETFLVSLSLALALATLAAPRSRVETLFLDEGFGTLDAQNLEQALGALDSLQAAGCQVGIISHVDGIAERIGACVEVLPEGGGQSRVRVRV